MRGFSIVYSVNPWSNFWIGICALYNLLPLFRKHWPIGLFLQKISNMSNSNFDLQDRVFLDEAFIEAVSGVSEGGIPIGSVLVHNNKIIGRGHNRRIQKGSSILHGEMDALENAGRYPAKVYRESTIYTTLSPCSMCSGAILLYGIPRVVIGENVNFKGEEELLKSRGVEVIVVNDKNCIDLMAGFIANQPALWNEDIGE